MAFGTDPRGAPAADCGGAVLLPGLIGAEPGRERPARKTGGRPRGRGPLLRPGVAGGGWRCGCSARARCRRRAGRRRRSRRSGRGSRHRPRPPAACGLSSPPC
ncbi:hypothetical protein SCOCK_10105 [Actinacidiphila cocklensis]|uniref:Uncharacterized protein n=1 Tax=Actinacidiphila cocklensis TaxID=887465 RepID=A0A9W4DI18_9ACTN|nr:hypothetical protein SCOCK_10105 [Actinacidiphila cocklensis]